MTGGGSHPASTRRSMSSTFSPQNSSSTGHNTGASGGPASRCKSSSGSRTGPSHQRRRCESWSASTALSLPGLLRNRATQAPSWSRSAAFLAPSSENSSRLVIVLGYPPAQLEDRRPGPSPDGFETQEMARLVEGVQRPTLEHRVVLPLRQPGVRRAQLRTGAPSGHAEQHTHRRHDDAGMAHRHHRLAGVVTCDPLEHASHPLVEAVPAFPSRCEHAIWFRLHLERAVAGGVLRPFQAVRLARVNLTQVALMSEDLKPESRSNDLGGLDRTRNDAGEQDVGAHATRLGEILAQRFGLLPAVRRQTDTTIRASDDALESRVRVAMADKDQSHTGHGTRCSTLAAPAQFDDLVVTLPACGWSACTNPDAAMGRSTKPRSGSITSHSAFRMGVVQRARSGSYAWLIAFSRSGTCGRTRWKRPHP